MVSAGIRDHNFIGEKDKNPNWPSFANTKIKLEIKKKVIQEAIRLKIEVKKKDEEIEVRDNTRLREQEAEIQKLGQEFKMTKQEKVKLEEFERKVRNLILS